MQHLQPLQNTNSVRPQQADLFLGMGVETSPVDQAVLSRDAYFLPIVWIATTLPVGDPVGWLGRAF